MNQQDEITNSEINKEECTVFDNEDKSIDIFENHTVSFTVNSFLIKNPKMQFVFFTTVGFLWMFFFRNMMQFYKDDIGMFIHAKNALLEIIMAVPFLFIYGGLVYAYFYYTAKIENIELTDKYLKFEGRRKVVIYKNSITEIHVIENNIVQKVVRILIYTNDRNLYSLNFMTLKTIQYITAYFKLEQLSSECRKGIRKEEISRKFKF